MPTDQLAKIALDLIATATVKADDQSLAIATAIRQLLTGIATGQLVITQRPKPTQEDIAA